MSVLLISFPYLFIKLNKLETKYVVKLVPFEILNFIENTELVVFYTFMYG